MSIEKFKSNIEDYLHLSTEAGDKGTKIQDWQDYQRNMNATVKNIIDAYVLWQPNKDLAADNVVRSPNMVSGTYARVTKAGTTAVAEPAWTGVGTTVTDGTVTYVIYPQIIDFAKQAEVTAGTVKDKIVTPASLSTLLTQIYAQAKLDAHPVGSIYESTDSTSPATLFGGTWEAMDAGRVLVAQGKAATGTTFTAGATGGEETHTLTTSELPVTDISVSGTTSSAGAHTHAIRSPAGKAEEGSGLGRGYLWDSVNTYYTESAGAHDHTFTGTGRFGEGAAHNVMQPYTVVYRWRRTA